MSQSKKNQESTIEKTGKTGRVPKKGTIGYITLEYMRDHEDVDVDILSKIIHSNFPESAWNKSHLAWYRHQVSKGNYAYPPREKGSKPIKAKKTKKGKKSKAPIVES